jgi:hypothetical protein
MILWLIWNFTPPKNTKTAKDYRFQSAVPGSPKKKKRKQFLSFSFFSLIITHNTLSHDMTHSKKHLANPPFYPPILHRSTSADEGPRWFESRSKGKVL